MHLPTQKVVVWVQQLHEMIERHLEMNVLRSHDVFLQPSAQLCHIGLNV
jgi:hypothetical protein